MKSYKQVDLGNQIYNPVYYELGNHPFNQLRIEQENRLHSQLEDQLRNQLRNKLCNQLCLQLYNQLINQLK
jgi:hypothetical protein